MTSPTRRPRRASRNRGAARRVSTVLVILLGLMVAAPSDLIGASPVDFPTGWLSSLFAMRVAWSAPKVSTGPAQRGGTAAGKSHDATAASTRHNGGTGSAPGHGKGALQAEKPRAVERPAKRVTGSIPGAGFQEGRSRRVDKDSTARTTMFANPDGSFTSKNYTNSINVKDADGSWKPVDRTLAKDDNNRLRPRRGDTDLSFGAKADDAKLAQVSIDGKTTIGYGLSGAAQVAGTLDDDTVSYANVLPGTDLTLAATTGGVKESIVLQAADAGNTWTFPLELGGLTPKLEKNRSIALRDDAGVVRAEIPPGFMHDARFDRETGDFTRSDAVDYVLTTVDGKPALKVTADATWIHDPARVFPITVDPSMITDTNDDTHVNNTDNSAHWSEARFQTGTYDGGVHKSNAYTKFAAFDNNYADSKINSAVLYLYLSWAYTCTAKPFSVYLAAADWNRTTVTYPGPGHTGSALATVTPDPGVACTNTGADPSIGKWVAVSLDVTTLQKWALGTGNNYGFEIVASGTDSTQWKKFTSTNGPAAAAPYLSVNYTPNNAPQVYHQYPATGQTNTLTPLLAVNADDPDNWPNAAMTFNFEVFNAAGTRISQSGYQSLTQWRVPSGLMSWTESYAWTVTAYDGNLYSNSQQVQGLVPTPEQNAHTGALSDNGDDGYDANAGNFTTRATDASVTTVGPALAIARQYNSADSRSTAFGPGWSSVLDSHITETLDGSNNVATVAITYPTGEDVTFGRNPNGAFIAPAGRFAQLSAVTGGYLLIDKDGTTYTFTTATVSYQKALTSIADAQGRTLTLTYDAAKHVVKLTAATGRTLTVAWNTAAIPHVASVTTDPATAGVPASALTWTYQYTGEQLTSVCAPGAGTSCRTYEYANVAPRQPGVVGELNPTHYWRLADPVGSTMASSSVLANQGTDVATYTAAILGQPGPEGVAGATAAGNPTVLLPTGSISQAASQSVSMWFKTSGGKVGPLFSYNPTTVASSNTSGPITPALYVGTSGKLYGQFWTGTVGPMSSSTLVNDDKWHHVVLAGGAGIQMLFLDGAMVASKAGEIHVPGATPYEYIGAGFMGRSWPDQNAYDPTNPLAYRRFFTGTIAEVAIFDKTLSIPADTSLYAGGGPGRAGEVVGEVRPTGVRASSVEYDAADGRLKKVTDDNGGSWQLGKPQVSGSHQNYSGVVLGAAPTDYWRLAESGTSLAVNEVNGNNAPYNVVTQGVPGGPFDDPADSTDDTTVAGFNGTTSYLGLPAADIPGAGAQSVSMWFKMAAGDLTGGVLMGYQDTALGTAPTTFTPALYVGTDGKLRGGYANSGGTTPITGTAVNDGKWHHVALAASATGQTLYLDGAAKGTLTAGPIATNAAFGFIGAGTTTGRPAAIARAGGNFNGQLAEIATFRSELTSAQVAAQYQARAGSTGTSIKTVTVTNPGGSALGYVYDLASDRKLADIDPSGDRTQYGYDTGGYLRTTTDADGNITITEQDVRGNTVSSTTCQDRSANNCNTSYFTYYPDATSKTLTPDARNDVLLTSRDGRSASATDNAYLTTYGYDAKGNRTTVLDALGRTVATAYTDGTETAADGGTMPPGLPKSVTTAAGAVQQVTYFTSGDVAKVTDPAGKVTNYTYDALGRIVTSKEVTSTFPTGLTTSYTYDSAGRVAQRTNPSVTNRVTGAVHTAVETFTYNLDGQVTIERIADSTGGDADRTNTYLYNGRGQLDAQTDAGGRLSHYEYDPLGKVIQESSGDGNLIKTSYDSEGHQLTNTLANYTGDPNNPEAGRDLTMESHAYDPAGRLASTTDAMGWVTEYTYFDNDLKATETRIDPQSGARFVVENNSYDGAGNLIQQISDNGDTTTVFSVDAANRTVSTTLDPSGLNRTTQLVLSDDDYPTLTTISDSDGVSAKTARTFDPLGRIKTETRYTDVSAPTLVTTYSLDENGLALAVTDTNGKTTNYEYDPEDRPVVSMAPQVNSEVNGGAPMAVRPTTTIGYNTFGDRTEQRDANGNVTTVAYDTAARPVTTTQPSYTPPGTSTPIVPVASRQFDALDRVTKVTDPLGRETSFVYDQLGRLAKKTEPNTGSSTFTYDLLGDQLSAIDPTGALHQSTYDYLGHKISDTDVVRQTNSADTTTYGFDHAGRATTTTSPSGVVSSTVLNDNDEVVSTTDGAGRTTTFRFDGSGRQTRVTNADGTYQSTIYDLADRVLATREYDASGTLLRSTAQQYDNEGNVLSATDARGTTKTFSYDALGRLTSQVEPISAADTIQTSFGYDAAGNSTRYTDGRGNPFLATFNSWGSPESRIEPATSAHPALADRTSTTVYDAAGQAVAQQFPGGVSISNQYDSMGSLTRQDGAGAEAATGSRTFAYDLDGRLIAAGTPQGTNNYTYDDRDLLVQASGPSGSSSFQYNADQAMTQRADAAGTTAFTYDTGGRLATLSNPGASLNTVFSYDDMSQIKSVNYGAGRNRILDYDKLHRLVRDDLQDTAGSSTARITYSYDPNNNETGKTTSGLAGASVNNYTYDLANRLMSWNNGTNTTAYAYDKSGNRVQAGSTTFSYDQRNRLTSDSNGNGYEYTARGTLKRAGSQQTTADAFGQIITQQGSAGQTQTYSYDALGRFVQAGFSYTGMDNDLAADGTASYVRDPDGALAGVATGTTKTAAWTDLHDDLVALVTGAGVAGSRAYDPMGQVLTQSAMIGNLGYQSEWTDPVTSRVNMHARWYNPGTGQFDTEDTVQMSPVGNSTSGNGYAYGDDTPLTMTDPTGHWGWGSVWHAVTSTVQSAASTVYHAAVTVYHAAVKVVKTVYHAAVHLATRVYHAAARVWHAARSYVSSGWHAVYHAANKAYNWGKQVYHKAQKTLDKAGHWVAKQAHRAGQLAHRVVKRAISAGQAVVTKATRAAVALRHKVNDAYKSTAKWVKDHKNQIIEVVAIVGAIAAGLACTAITAGAGAVACMIGTAALINLAKDSAQGNVHSLKDAAISFGVGAASGALGLGAGAALGKVGGAVAGRFIGGAGTRAGTAAAEGSGGRLAGTMGKLRTFAGGSRGCLAHSFAPNTGVRMADGSVRAIKDVNVGDRVTATDPITGKTSGRSVRLLHINQDNQLTDVTVAVGKHGHTAIVHTTEHHRFWDLSVRRWVAAGELRVGKSTVRTVDNKRSVVVGVHNFGARREMRDLTVETVHSYYVMAGNTPVLVHNCGGATFVADASGNVVPTSASRLESGLQAAVDAGEEGFSTFPTRSSGTGFELPDGSRIRIMQPSANGNAGLRASFTNSADAPVSPFTGKPVQPPSGISPKPYVRSRTHVDLEP